MSCQKWNKGQRSLQLLVVMGGTGVNGLNGVVLENTSPLENPNPFYGGIMDILWNCTVHVHVSSIS